MMAIISQYHLAFKYPVMLFIVGFVFFAVTFPEIRRRFPDWKESFIINSLFQMLAGISSFCLAYAAVKTCINLAGTSTPVRFVKYARDTIMLHSLAGSFVMALVWAVFVVLMWRMAGGPVIKLHSGKINSFRIADILMWLVSSVFLFVFYVLKFIKVNFGDVSIESIIFQMNTPLDGAGTVGKLVEIAWMEYIIPFAVVAAFMFIFFNMDFFRPEISFGRGKAAKSAVPAAKVYRRLKKAVAALMVVAALAVTERSLGVVRYFTVSLDTSEIYEEYYVDAEDVQITFPQTKRNLVYIVMESMETTYITMGEKNYIPQLTQLAQDNISFSHNTEVGGFDECFGAEWTMGALLGVHSGVPYNMPLGENKMSLFKDFLPGMHTSLGEILEDNGYRNVFMCGSDVEFGGRGNFFAQHGNYEMPDFYTAREEDYIPDDYYVFWGHEDEILYERAKDYLTELSSQDQPFNFTLLTVDTHFEDGYVCDLCQDEHGNQYANVMTCADRQVMDFLAWLQRQPFYENTTVVISGDHCSMDVDFFNDVDSSTRRVYNCFVNTPAGLEPVKTTDRTFTTVDMFPTILASMGVEIEGDRLALGTNLFSERQTLAEEMGLETFQTEIAKKSAVYDRFISGTEE